MRKKLRRLIKVTLSYFLFYSGALAVVRWTRRNKEGLGILMYHRVTENGEEGVPLSVFEKQIDWIHRHYSLMPLSQVLLTRKEGGPLPRRVFTVTVDDGHRDFLGLAYPILKKRDVPTTLFVVSDCLDGKPLWTRALKGWFQKTILTHLEVSVNGETHSFSLKTESEKSKAREILKEILKRVEDTERRASLREIQKKLVGEAGEDEETEFMLTWEEVLNLSQGGVEIGAHTLDHPILTQMPLEEARYQILESRRRLEQRLGKPVQLFCYPNGEPQDFNEEIERILKDSGFLGACTIIEGENGAAYNPYALKRIVTWERLLPVFACQLEGCFDRFAGPQRSLREEAETLYAPTMRKRSATAPVIVLGQSRTAVGVNRLLARRAIPVIKVAKNSKSVGVYSRYGEFVKIDLGDTEALLSLMKKVGERYRAHPVLLPTGDDMVKWLSESRDPLLKEGRYLFPEEKVIETVLDKALFAMEARRLGIAVPATVNVKKREDLESILHNRHFPYVMKPSDGYQLQFGEEKAIWISSEGELERIAAPLLQEEVPFLIQEVIPGEDSCHWSCAVYLGPEGKPLACFTARKIRQYPPLVGMASLCESRWNEQVASEAISLLQKLRYVGVAEVEFKEDPRDGALKVIEVNPRLWAQHPLAARAGIDFAFLVYQGSLGIFPRKTALQRDGIRWLAPDLDLLTVRQLFREGKMDVAKWLGPYRRPIETDLFHLSDPGPAIYQTAKLAKSFLLKKRRVF